jgi:CheY-like chemotaxis protein
MRVLCVARHQILSEHLGRFFERFDVATAPVVGMRQARASIATHDPDVALCDYDLLTPTQLELWRADRAARAVPIVAVSMTKRPHEVTMIEERGVVAFVYLPTLQPATARALFAALRRQRNGVVSPSPLTWPLTTPAARLR